MKPCCTFILVIATCFILTGTLKAQQNSFSKVLYDDLGSVSVSAVANTADTGFLLAGQYNGEALILKLNAEGTIQWGKSFGESGNEIFTCLVPILNSPDGVVNDSTNYLTAGRYYTPGSPNSVIWYAKISPAGDTLWNKAIDFGTEGPFVASMCQTSDSGFIMSGNIALNASPYSKIFVIRISKNSSVVWANSYAVGSNTGNAWSVRQTADQGFILAGEMAGITPYEQAALLIKLTPEGQVSWGWKYKVSANDQSYATDVLAMDDGFLCSFYSSETGLNLMKTDFSGAVTWNKAVPVNGGWSWMSTVKPKLHITADHNLAFVTPGQFGLFLKLDFSGNLLLQDRLFLEPAELVQTPDHGYMIVGNGPLIGVKKETHNPQVGLIRTDSLGNGPDCIWPELSNSFSYSVLKTAVTIAASSGYFAADLSPVITAIALSEQIGCVAFIGGIGEPDTGAEEISCYPNPSSGLFTLKTRLPELPENSLLRIYNELGKPVIEKYLSSANENLINMTAFPGGLYTVSLLSEGKVLNTRIIIQRDF